MMVSSLGPHLEQWQECYTVEIVLNVYIKTESISVSNLQANFIWV